MNGDSKRRRLVAAAAGAGAAIAFVLGLWSAVRLVVPDAAGPPVTHPTFGSGTEPTTVGSGTEPTITRTTPGTTVYTSTQTTTTQATTTTTRTTTSEDPIDSAIGALGLGNIAFNTPKSVRLHDDVEVQLVVSRHQALVEVGKAVTAPGSVEKVRVKTSGVMVATLTGLDFNIQANSAAEQPVPKEGHTTWSWDIEPKKTGTLQLVLSLLALITVDNKERQHPVETFRKTLTITVPWHTKAKNWIGDNWQFLTTVVVIPIAGIAWRRRKSKQPKKGDSGDSSPSTNAEEADQQQSHSPG